MPFQHGPELTQVPPGAETSTHPSRCQQGPGPAAPAQATALA